MPRQRTTEQAKGSLPLETQRQITGYAMMKGRQVAEFFVEAGVSGSVPLVDRPKGERMLATLQPGDVVITAKLDRAFRSAANLERVSPITIYFAATESGNKRTGADQDRTA